MSYRQNEDKSGQKRIQTDWGGKADEANDAPRYVRKVRTDEDVALERKFGIDILQPGEERTGYLFNMKVSSVVSEDEGIHLSALLLYFVQRDGRSFRASLPFRPYLLVDVLPSFGQGNLDTLVTLLQQKYEGKAVMASLTEKDDLGMADHLTGRKHTFIKLTFPNTETMSETKRTLMGIVKSNLTRHRATKIVDDDEDMGINPNIVGGDPLDYICGLYEHDVNLVNRVCIDQEITAGRWYQVTRRATLDLKIEVLPKMLNKPELRVFAFDIETSKTPLKFPDATVDPILMISVMCDGQGFLLVNRTEVSEDIPDFEYTPKPEYEGFFQCINCATETAMLQRFFELIVQTGPHIVATFNGDSFDLPYVKNRSDILGLDLLKETGLGTVQASATEEFFTGKWMLHLDCFCWVQRDSYLPQGSQGLKAVTKAKLKYNPVDLDPELITPYARDRPQELCTYSVSDAVATFYLYKKYIHDFIFALSSIIPANPDDVLRKGSGTLCELLLMAQAFRAGVVFPNKHVEERLSYHNGRLIENSTYEGGRVECLRTGIFRADFPEKFKIDPTAIDQLRDEMESIIDFFLFKEEQIKDKAQVENYHQVKQQIDEMLANLTTGVSADYEPLIYHLDVAAMYPNIILSNRLQPTALITAEDCGKCSFGADTEGNNCQRKMNWKWRGDLFMATKSDVKQIQRELEAPNHRYVTKINRWGNDQSSNNNRNNKDSEATIKVPWKELSEKDQMDVLLKNVRSLSMKAYKRVKSSVFEEKQDIVCQRENPFYINTIRAFRDRRYEFKDLVKVWNKKKESAEGKGDLVGLTEAKDMVLLFDSLQLAHKCILNSFYGYVMRKGARWHSMKMGGIVTFTGSNLIREAREFVERVGLPLELDTDGIWCMLPGTFPDVFKFTLKNMNVVNAEKELQVAISERDHLLSSSASHNEQSADTLPMDADISMMLSEDSLTSAEQRVIDAQTQLDQIKQSSPSKVVKMSFPCSVLNRRVHLKYTNDQYQTFNEETKKWETSSENSIFFEIDGPYKAMVLPASTEEDKMLKKRYAVYNHDGSIAELKGFEIKRRGELKLIQVFQEEVFPLFLAGRDRPGVYEAVGAVANRWLAVLDSKGYSLSDEEVLYLISEKKSMSKSVEESGDLKSASITTARRVAEFLGDNILKERGMSIHLVIANRPDDAKPTERAIPVAIFSAAESVKRSFLKKWLGDPFMTDFDMRAVIDWDYYRGRLGGAIHKLVVIPALNQRIPNPCPSLALPDWMKKKVAEWNDKYQQVSLMSMWKGLSVTQKKTLPEPSRASEPSRAVDYGDDHDEDDVDDHDVPDIEDDPETTAARRAIASARVAEIPDGIEPTKKKSLLDQFRSSVDSEAPTQAPIATGPAAPQLSSASSVKEWLSEVTPHWDTLKSQIKEEMDRCKRKGLKPVTGKLFADLAVGIVGKTSVFGNRKLAVVPWHVLSVEPLNEDGKFVVWVASESAIDARSYQIQRITCDIHRKFFVKTDSENLEASSDLFADVEWRKLQDIEPTQRVHKLRGQQPSSFWVEVTLPEGSYKSCKSKWFSVQSGFEGISVAPLGYDPLPAVAKVQDPSSLTPEFFNAGEFGKIGSLTDCKEKYLGAIRSTGSAVTFTGSSGNLNSAVHCIPGLEEQFLNGIASVIIGAALKVQGNKTSEFQDLVSSVFSSSCGFPGLFVHIAQATTGNRVFGVVHDPRLKKFSVIYAGVNATMRPSVAVLTKAVHDAISSDSDQSENNGVSVNFGFVDSVSALFKSLNKTIEEWSRINPGMVLVASVDPKVIPFTGSTSVGDLDDAISTDNSISRLRSGLRAQLPVAGFIPVAFAPLSQNDLLFPAFDWPKWAISRYVERASRIQDWWGTQLTISRISRIPLCDLPVTDPEGFAWNVMVGRAIGAEIVTGRYITSTKKASWVGASVGAASVSASCKTISSAEETAKKLLVPNGSSDNKNAVLASGVTPTGNTTTDSAANSYGQVSHPGVYRSICLSMSLHTLLCSAALVKAKQLSELEAGELVTPIIQSTLSGGSSAPASNIASMGGSFGASEILPVFIALSNTVSDVYNKGITAQVAMSKIVSQLTAPDTENQLRKLQDLLNQEASSFATSALGQLSRASEFAIEMQTCSRLVERLYAWISDVKSPLYSPELHRKVCDYMGKYLRVIISELKKLGCTVISASFNNIQFATNKTAFNEVHQLWSTIKKNFANHDILQSLTINDESIANAYYGMIFMDKANFVAVPVDKRGTIRWKAESHWKLSEFLPPATRVLFYMFAGDFLVKPMRTIHELREPSTDKASKNAAVVVSAEPVSNAVVLEMLPSILKDQLLPSLKKKLFTYVTRLEDDRQDDLVRIQYEEDRIRKGFLDDEEEVDSDESDSEDAKLRRAKSRIDDLKTKWSFPAPPGAVPGILKNNSSNPTVEFVKYLCEVFALERSDSAIQSSLDNLRSDLLRLLKVKLFAPEAAFMNPRVNAPACILHDVCCDRCGEVVDVDVTTQPNQGPGLWECGNCSTTFDRENMEARLVEVVEDLVLAWQQQPLVCERCKKFNYTRCLRFCECSGKFVSKYDRKAALDSLLCIRSVAIPHNLHWLNQVVDGYVQILRM